MQIHTTSAMGRRALIVDETNKRLTLYDVTNDKAITWWNADR